MTADEITDPQELRVRMWNNGELRHDTTVRRVLVSGGGISGLACLDPELRTTLV